MRMWWFERGAKWLCIGLYRGRQVCWIALLKKNHSQQRKIVTINPHWWISVWVATRQAKPHALMWPCHGCLWNLSELNLSHQRAGIISFVQSKFFRHNVSELVTTFNSIYTFLVPQIGIILISHLENGQNLSMTAPAIQNGFSLTAVLKKEGYVNK